LIKFILISIIGSILLTLLLNFLPLIFPNTAACTQKKLEDHARQSIAQHEDPDQPRVKIFFPWKFMLIVSIGLTLAINLVAMITR